MWVKELFYYETIKLVTVKNWKLGLINRIMQFLVVVYIAVYAIYLNRGYQKASPIEGVLFTKVKGLSRDNVTNQVYDSGDLVVPPIENNALFVATRALNTFQTETQSCPDPDVPCHNQSDCVSGKQSSNGYILPQCNLTHHRCMIQGWCPAENESLPFTEFSGIEEWTIFMRSSVTYTAFGLSTNNADNASFGYNIFSITNMTANLNYTDMHKVGGVINVKIDWSCDLDFGINLCTAKYSYYRTDYPGNASVGFNFRRSIYISSSNSTEYGFPRLSERIYTKFYGLRFVFQIVGTGMKFDIVTTVVTIGSGVAFLSIASILTDFILQYLHPKKSLFDHYKRQPVDLQTEETGSAVSERTNLV